MGFLKRCHPIIFAVGPILFLYARNSRELTLAALPLPVMGALALAVAVWGGFRLLQQDRDRAALMASAVLLPFFSYGALYQSTTIWRALIPAWPYLFFLVWLLLVVLLVVVLARIRYPAPLVSEGLSVTAAIFLLLVVTSIGRVEWQRRHDQRETTNREIVTAVRAATPIAQLPNIYYIILDSYGREDRLAQHFDFDNRKFTADLQKRGFYVAQGSNANYCQTITSLPSTLNLTYLDEIAKTAGKTRSDRQPLSDLMRDSAVRRILKQHGYRVVAFPSSYAPVNMPTDVPMQRLTGYADFYFAAVNSTPLALISLREGSILDYYSYHRNTILWQLEHLPKTTNLPGPNFVYAHILAPHLPYVFDEHGNPIKGDPIAASERRASQWSRGEETPDDVHRYCDELIYLNKRVLEMLDRIQASAKRPTVIILQSDHGPGVLPNNYGEIDKLDPPLRFGILNAFHFPDGPPPEIYPSISSVNTFRLVFNHYLGTDYPLLKDEHFFSPYTYPYDLTPMTDKLGD